MDVSIAICTRNRAVSLARTLDSLTAMSIPDGLKWEVIVVNNACTDNTDTVIARFRTLLPLYREFEAAPGLSHARNRAVTAAKGAYIMWTDDDVIVDPGWLAAYAQAFRKWQDAALFGGKIIPLFEEPMPAWLRECWTLAGHAYAFRDFGDDPLPISVDRDPYGANFAVRTQEQRAYPYNPSLGAGARIPTGEETDIIVRMLKDGKSGYWVPGARVQHCTPHARQTLQYIRSYYRGQGWRRALRDSDTAREPGSRPSAPRWLVPRLMATCCRYQLSRWTMPSTIWMEHYIRYAFHQGQFDFHRSREIYPAGSTAAFRVSSGAMSETSG